MRIVQSFPHEVVELENVLVPMADGVRLAARIWLPAGAERHPVPAVLEAIPYRKRDATRERDEAMHRWFAGHGYAAIRLDIRGSGESEGFLEDEYLPREQEDGVSVIEWIAAQPWCSGAVGMIGKSWGGFAALQIAALRPPALKAVIAVCATDDRYADDAHYMGGCLLNENLMWGSGLLAVAAHPPDPALVGARWRDIWRERLERLPLFPATWLRHPTRDAYWRHGSVAEHYDRLECPVFAVSGWADGYSNAVPRLLAGLTAPRRGLVGPWAHVYPHQGVPGPAIGFLQEARRWWDRWLKDEPNGADDGPIYRVWMQEHARPGAAFTERPGRWVAEDEWPSPRVRPRRYGLEVGRLVTRRSGKGAAISFSSPQSTGLAAGAWCGFGIDGETPDDQRADDGKSLVFDTLPLKERFESLGAPELTATITSDRPCALIAVRLSDVAPDGSSLRVSYGLLNLTHRGGHEAPAPLETGAPVTVRVRLSDLAHAFPEGHRIRLSLSTAYWPMVWPSPEPVTLTLDTIGSALTIPERPPRAADDALPPFDPPETALVGPSEDLDDAPPRRTISRDLTTGEVVYESLLDLGEDGEPIRTRIEDIDLVVGHSVLERFTIRDHDPGTARAEVRQIIVAEREGHAARLEIETRLSATSTAFRLQATLIATDDGRPFVTRTWDEEIPRVLV